MKLTTSERRRVKSPSVRDYYAPTSGPMPTALRLTHGWQTTSLFESAGESAARNDVVRLDLVRQVEATILNIGQLLDRLSPPDLADFAYLEMPDGVDLEDREAYRSIKATVVHEDAADAVLFDPSDWE